MATDSMLVSGNTKVNRTDKIFTFGELLIQVGNIWGYLGK